VQERKTIEGGSLVPPGCRLPSPVPLYAAPRRCSPPS